MTEDGKKYDAMIKACNISKEELIEAGQMKGFMGIYNLGLENMYDYLIKNSEIRKHGSWFLLDECANEGVYCSVCHKKVYKTDYANQKIKSKYCPNCGAIMDLDGDIYDNYEEVISYEEWSQPEDDIQNGLTVVVKGEWISG